MSELHRVLQWILSIGEKQLDARGYQRMEYSLIQGALKQLDSHSALLPAFVYEQFRINLRGKFTGIGISVDVRDSQVFITDVVRGVRLRKRVYKKMTKFSVSKENLWRNIHSLL